MAEQELNQTDTQPDNQPDNQVDKPADVKTSPIADSQLDTGEGDDETIVDDAGDGITQEESEFLDIVKAGTTGDAKPDLKRDKVEKMFQKKAFKAKERLEAANQQTASANQETQTLQQENELQRLAIEQLSAQLGDQAGQPAAPVKPNHADFIEGRDDPKYQEALDAFNTDNLNRTVAVAVAAATEGIQPAPAQSNGKISPDIEKRQRAHLERAVDLNVDDYEETEQLVADAFGSDIVNRVIDSFDTSDKMIYYLGKNPAEAKSISQMLKGTDRQAIRGIAALGKLEDKVNGSKRKFQTTNAGTDSRNDPAPAPGERQRGPVGATFE